MSIIFSDDEDDKSYCSPPCDALLIERKDGSSICSYCGREYRADSVKKHKREFGPDKETSQPEVVPLEAYHNPEKSKKPKSPIDREDEKMYKRPGFSWTSKEDIVY